MPLRLFESKWVSTVKEPRLAVPLTAFEFKKRCQLFVGGDDEPLSVVAVCICNEDRSTVRTHS
jgi:hypothetical protein